MIINIYYYYIIIIIYNIFGNKILTKNLNNLKI